MGVTIGYHVLAVFRTHTHRLEFHDNPNDTGSTEDSTSTTAPSTEAQQGYFRKAQRISEMQPPAEGSDVAAVAQGFAVEGTLLGQSHHG